MMQLFKRGKIAIVWLIIIPMLVGIEQSTAQNNANESFESKFVDVGNVKLQYLDFGGDGLPILFIHNLLRGASTWKENVVPAARKNEQLFKKAFGDDLKVVTLEVPFVTGYSYMNASERIEQPIREFLAEVRAKEHNKISK